MALQDQCIRTRPRPQGWSETGLVIRLQSQVPRLIKSHENASSGCKYRNFQAAEKRGYLSWGVAAPVAALPMPLALMLNYGSHHCCQVEITKFNTDW